MPTRFPLVRTAARRALALGALAWLSLAVPTGAQETDKPAGEPAAAPAPQRRATFITNHADMPVARAVRTRQHIDVDGNLDEPAWATASPVTDFWQYDPDTGLPISEPIEVRILYDDDALYVGAHIWDKQLVTRLARKDGFANDTDIFIVYLDSYHDHRTAYRFAINASGWRRDLILSGGGGGGAAGLAGGDVSWDPVWEVKTRIVQGAWFVEMRIPFSQLRFSPAREQVWGLQLERKIRPVTEENVWSWTPGNQAGGVARFGHLVGLEGIRPGRKLEALPYLAARAEYVDVPRNAAVSFANPFRSGSDYFGTGGVDLKYRLTSNLTLDGTINPDFGQVELDPAVINLTAFETRYMEHRPFFVEGAEIFDFGEGGPTLVYSRRVGRAPQGKAPGEAVYADLPPTTTILGAGKVTGKTANGWSVGVIDAVTARERATWLGANHVESRYEVEPATNYFAGRVRKEMRSGQTVVGMLATAVDRSLGGSPLEPILLARAYTGGLDLTHEWANRVWQLQAHVSPSWVSGSEAALVALQRTSRRYFQRPDAGHGVDSTATVMAGYQARAAIAKQAGLLRFNLDALAISPGYEVNDLGFQTEAGRLKAILGAGLQHTRPGRHLRNWSVTGTSALVWNYEGDHLGAETGLTANAQLNNLARVNGSLTVRPEALDDRLTRGGPLALQPTGYAGSLRYNTDQRTAVSGSLGLSYGGDRSGAWNTVADVTAAWRMSTRVETTLQPTVTWSYATAQYVSTLRDAEATRTFARRYLFADLHQTTASLTGRVNVIVTPEISFELYAQPFLSSGRYDRIKELRAPRTFDFVHYGVDAGTVTRTAAGGYVIDPDAAGPAKAFELADQDFNVRSMRGNAVFRWEWRAGSTLFLVWQQSRYGKLVSTSADADVGSFDFGRDARALFRIRPDNIFMLKVNYWLNP